MECPQCGCLFGGKFKDGVPEGDLGRGSQPIEPRFILRAQDQSAPAVLRTWLVMNASAPKEKLDSARRILEAMINWPKKKSAD